VAESQGDTLFVLKGDTPDGLALGDELANEVTSLEIPDLDATVASTTDDTGVVELQACNTIIMSCEAVDGAHLLEGPDADGSVRATGHEGVSTHLQLADKASVALQDGEALAGDRVSDVFGKAEERACNSRGAGIPDTDVGVEASSDDTVAIEGDGVDLAEVTLEGLDAATSVDVPDLGRGVVASGDDNVALDLEATDTSSVADEDMAANAVANVPDTKGGIPRA
jgi:hypothetical protein